MFFAGLVGGISDLCRGTLTRCPCQAFPAETTTSWSKDRRASLTPGCSTPTHQACPLHKGAGTRLDLATHLTCNRAITLQALTGTLEGALAPLEALIPVVRVTGVRACLIGTVTSTLTMLTTWTWLVRASRSQVQSPSVPL